MKADGKWWTQTWNPVVGCTPISAGCKNCWAKRMHDRHLSGGVRKPFSEITLHHDRLAQPLRRRKPCRVAACLMGDLFHDDVPEEFIDSVFAIMAICGQHTFHVLTKRPDRMADYLGRDEVWVNWHDHMPSGDAWEKRERQDRLAEPYGDNWPLPNVIPGTSVEDQATADKRIPHLLKCPAARRFISIEPMLGPVDLDSEEAGHAHALGCGNFECECGDRGVDWVIVGSESGPGARPMELDWVRSIRDQCKAAGVALWFKQNVVNGERVNMPELDGFVYDQMP